jgi:hypothetical protein
MRTVPFSEPRDSYRRVQPAASAAGVDEILAVRKNPAKAGAIARESALVFRF